MSIGSLHVKWQAMVSACFKRVAELHSETSFQGSEVWRSRSHEAAPSDAAGERKSQVGGLRRRLAVDGQHLATVRYCIIPPLQPAHTAPPGALTAPCRPQQSENHALSAYHPLPLNHHLHHSTTMAIAKPIRFMAGATMLLFVFLLYTMMSSPASIDGLVGPNEAQKKDDMLRDPNLDGTNLLSEYSFQFPF